MPIPTPLKRFVFFGSLAAYAGVELNRWFRSSTDEIKNPSNDTFLNYANDERLKNKTMFSPFVTKDEVLLKTFQMLCPHVPISNPTELTPPYFDPVKLRVLNPDDSVPANSQPVSLVVGGAPAAMVAMQKSVDGKKVVYVNYRQKDKRPISTGAANHGEWDAETELPAYTAGRTPISFFKNATLELLSPTRFKDEHPEWLTLNYYEWFMNPGQWL